MADSDRVVFHDGRGGKIVVGDDGRLVAVYDRAGHGMRRAGPSHALRIFRAAMTAQLAEESRARETFSELTGGYQPLGCDEHGHGPASMLRELDAFRRQGPSMYEVQPTD